MTPAARRSQERMLDVEARALTALRAAVQATVEAQAPRLALGASLASLRGPLVLSVGDTVALARRAARRAGRLGAADEVAAIRQEIQRAGFVGPAVEAAVAAAETERARAVAEAYADALVERAARLEPVEGRRVAAGRAVAALDYRIQTDAATEVAHAFNDEREQIGAELRSRHSDARWFPAMLTQWDARLDACPRCKALDGTMRPLGLKFGGLTPGKPHPRCRCIGVFIFSPLYLGRAEQEAA